ncbi:mesoderm posterior protein 2 [Carlito syrichta]|uniref:Mesoderm posterior protein 2 n=1 Tax=Carlito syrichta TaxID=1868482 RepID=A0A1U7U976_CARSF|nr:mesoderm posterior protein 2 [Carlito syrichta]
MLRASGTVKGRESETQQMLRRNRDLRTQSKTPHATPGMLSTAVKRMYGAGASWGAPPACPGPGAAPELLGSVVPDTDPWVTPPYCPKMQSPPHSLQGRTRDASLWTSLQACPGPQASPEPQNPAVPRTTPPASLELAAVYQGVSVSPESCLSLGTPSLLPRPSCQRLQPQAQWECWSHSAEVLSSSEDQGPRPAFQLREASPPQSSGLRLSGCPELWQEDLEGAPLDIFY